ncbi:MAG: hypothetical protein JNM70_00380 [Anaerolineae bacterium]|nr:hypothetical protein [Anaerolineae bacterium]
MDISKCNQLKAFLSQHADLVIPIAQFFDGNDDEASIGCNLIDYPGIPAFRDTFAAIARRPDVEAVYALINEIDPGEGCWPFTDVILFVGTASPKEIERILKPLQPDEVKVMDAAEVPATIAARHHAPVLLAWWD